MFRTAVRMVVSSANYTGATGRSYVFKQLILERPYAGRIWLARSCEENFVLKDISENTFAAFESSTRAQIKASPHLRLPIDSIPSQRIFVYRYFTEDFLALVKSQIPLEGRKEILKASLQGLVDLHAQGVVHLDIKPDNILVGFYGSGSDFAVEKTQFTDLENAAYLPKGRCIKGILPGNDNWRSPEGHLRGTLNKPTDIFSFGAMRQVSYFGDKDGINGLLTHVGDDDLSLQLLSNAYGGKDDDYHGYKHFSTWPEVKDESFKDLILSTMSLDPNRRITAKQVLEHQWFESVQFW